SIPSTGHSTASLRSRHSASCSPDRTTGRRPPMVSPDTAPATEPRAPRATRLLLALAVALPLALVAAGMAHDGWLSDTHGAFLSRVRFAVERGRLELLGFEYPPLPFLLLVPWATTTATWLLGSAAIAAIAW